MWEAIAVAAAGGGGVLGSAFTRFLDRKKYRAEIEHLKSETDVDKAERQAVEVGIMRSILEEVRKDSKDKTAQIVNLNSQVRAMSDRVIALEERERLNLTRVAVHESWDSIAYSLLIDKYPDHPPPPPLRDTQLSKVKANNVQLEFGETVE